MPAFIVDDLKVSRDTLKKMIALYYPEVEIVGESGDYLNALLQMQKKKFDLLFLDINLGNGETGFTILDRLKNFKGAIIVVTAYSEYAVKAFKYGAAHYLIKPIDPIDLVEAINRAWASLPPSAKNDFVVDFVDPDQKVSLFFNRGIEVFLADHIIYLEGSGSYTIVHFHNRPEAKISRNMKYIFELLHEFPQFKKVHKSYIINKKYITRYSKSEGGYLELYKKYKIPVSINYKDEVEGLFLH